MGAKVGKHKNTNQDNHNDGVCSWGGAKEEGEEGGREKKIKIF